MLEYCIREDLKIKKSRMMAVLDPIKLIIDNYPEGQVEYLDVANNLENEELGNRKVPFGRELYIEREDFMEEPPKKYFRLFPGNEVRLMNAYFVKCDSFVKDENGNITEIHCTYDPETKSGSGFTGRKVKGTIHWVPAPYAVKAEVRLYENIVDEEKGVYNKEDGSFQLESKFITILKDCYLEPSFDDAKAYDSFQFVRNGYFCIDAKDSAPDALVFNRIVSLEEFLSNRQNKQMNELTINLKTKSDMPLYEQIYRHIIIEIQKRADCLQRKTAFYTGSIQTFRGEPKYGRAGI